MIRINPSLASADPLRLAEQIDKLEGYPFLHLDMEDGNFVPNLTFGIKTVRAVAAYANQQLDVHLMVTAPGAYIEELLDIGVKRIAFHIESAPYPSVYLNRIRERGGKAGLAFNCMEPVESALPYENSLDYVLIMTSEPDGRGQKFNPYMLEKIRRVKELFSGRIEIMADGGISEEQMDQVMTAGADILVMGRAVWNAEMPGRKVREFTERAERRER